MNLDFTPDQRIIRDEAARFLQEQSPSTAVRRIVDAGGGTDEALWNSVSRELGWCAMAIPEDYGGVGLGLTELVILQELCGARLSCMPFWATTCLAVPLLLHAASEEARSHYLPLIAAGEITATVAYSDPGGIDQFGSVSIRAEAVDGGYRLDGKLGMVIDLAAADLVLVPALLVGGGVALFALERQAGFEVIPLVTLDATRPAASLALSSLQVPAAARIDDGGVSRQAMEKACSVAALGLAAEQAGSARGAMDLTLAYIGERMQFGRTIASFQAIKHRCARLEVDLAEARALIYGAAANSGEPADQEQALEVAGARLLAAEIAYLAAEEAIQLHGGVGFTWEYDPHLYFKRAQASAALFGGPDAQLDAIADALLGRGAAA